jgi:hypothetical protein
MKLSVDSLTKGLEFHGEVQGKRQRYYILSSPRQYFVMSVSLAKRDAGNFNIVSRAAVDALYRKLRGRRGLTARLVSDRFRKGRLVTSSLNALNMLYVMAATGRATIDAKRKTPQIFFNVLRRPEGER